MSDSLEAYEMEKAIFARLMNIGRSALKAYFASLGTGDVGPELTLDDGTLMKKQRGLYGRDYFSVFGKLKVPRTCYRAKESTGVMPLDTKANLPKRCYSYLLQEWMDIFCLRDSFKESEISLNKLMGLEISQSRFEVVSRESDINYDEFYDQKLQPDPETEGELLVNSFDGKGVPVIKKEAAKIKARLDKGEKKQKKKEAMVAVSYTIDRNIRTPEQVACNLVYPEKSRQPKSEKNDTAPPCVKAQNIRRMASLERSKEEVMTEIFKDADKRDPDKMRLRIVVMDGALCLWTLVASVLKDVNYIGILDIIHVVEYLWDAVNALDKGENMNRHKWVYARLVSIKKGTLIEIEIKAPDGKGKQIVSTPHNTDAQYTRKRNQVVTGHKGFLTETCDPDNDVQYITDVVLGAAGHADAVKIDKIETRLEENEFKPEALYGDAGFVNGESILKAAEKGIEFEGPSAGRSQSIEGFTEKDRPLDVADFKVEFEDTSKELIVLSCPNNESPLDQIKSEKTGQWLFHFDNKTCKECPLQNRCPVKHGATISTLTINEAQYAGAQRHQKYMKDTEYRKKCGVRAGAEGLVNEVANKHGARKSRHRTEKRSRLQIIFAAIACNTKRVQFNNLDFDLITGKRQLIVGSTNPNCLILLNSIFQDSVLFGQEHTNLNYQITPHKTVFKSSDGNG